jgi:hypothetical protein
VREKRQRSQRTAVERNHADPSGCFLPT